MALFKIDDKVYYQSSYNSDYIYYGLPAVVTKVIEDDTDILYVISFKLNPVEADSILQYVNNEDDLTAR